MWHGRAGLEFHITWRAACIQPEQEKNEKENEIFN